MINKIFLSLTLVVTIAQPAYGQNLYIEENSFQDILILRLEGFTANSYLSVHTDEACLSTEVSSTIFQLPFDLLAIQKKLFSERVYLKDHGNSHCLKSDPLPSFVPYLVGRGEEPLLESAFEGIFHLEQITEIKTTPAPKPIDILWVIDSSGSMSEEQQFLSDQFISFSEQLKNSDKTFRMAVTTTDICPDSIPEDVGLRACPIPYGGNTQTRYQGGFVGPILYSEDANLSSLFQQQALVGTSGSGFEHGLKAIEMALDKSEQGINPSYPSQDAFFSVIVISDEEDDGIGLQKTDAYSGINYTLQGKTTFSFSPSDLITSMEQKLETGNFSISAITGTRKTDGDLCHSPHSQPQEEGTAFIEAASRTGGVVHSICETQWDNLLATLAQQVSTQSEQIILAHTPIASSIKVFQSGEALTWEYIPQLNALRLTAASLNPGDEIRIEYTALIQ